MIKDLKEIAEHIEETIIYKIRITGRIRNGKIQI